jgi:phenylalanyl-tRNA synthetase beta chain
VKILLSWLRDFVDIPVDGHTLARDLTMRGFEVASIDRVPASSDDNELLLDLEITANRPDCLSVVGIAREVATMYQCPLNLPSQKDALSAPEKDEPSISVTVNDPDLCPRYAVRMAKIKVQDSPSWLTYRLEACGIRPINNIVDVTNYVLLELGQPMHAFDFDCLQGGALRVRRAQATEQIMTLDGQQRKLTEQMLIIADEKKPQGIAGIMGGATSEVSESTQFVALESAHFHPVSVRRTSKKLALNTDAAYRFERGADISAPIVALERACNLLEQINAGHCIGPPIDHYPNPQNPTQVRLRHKRVEHVLGQSIDKNFIDDALKRLGFTLNSVNSHTWDVTVPHRRVDVTREVDLIEEVARHHGYDQLPSTFPPLTTASLKQEPHIEDDRRVRRLATAAGFSEAVTFAFIKSDIAKHFVEDSFSTAVISNPLSAQFEVLRPSLIPGLISSLSYNLRRNRQDVRLFEVATCFKPVGERRTIAFAWTGTTHVHWSEPARTTDFFDMKGVVEHLCADLTAVEVAFTTTTAPFLKRGQAACLCIPDGKNSTKAIGVVGQLAPAVVVQFDLSETDVIYVAEINLDALAEIAPDELCVTPLPRHPSIIRDLSIVIPETLPASTVRGTIMESAPDTLVSIREFDRYVGPGVGAGNVSLSLRLSFRAVNRTLTDAEVQQSIDRVVTSLIDKHGVQLR